MIKYYRCTFQTDTILSSSSATQGESKPLNYIPGTKFLGIVAKILYDDKSNREQTIDLFHNSKVQFGDAHLEFENRRTLQIPLMWQFPKKQGLEGDLYLDYKLDNNFRKELTSQDIQLKQARSGFFDLKSQSILNIDYVFSLKSSYDSDLKKSEEGNMFGYYGIKKGTSWIFYIKYNDEKYIEIIEKSLFGEKKIGRSKSAQYGQVKIEYIAEYEEQDYSSKIELENDYLIYAESNLCFYDEYNQNTLKPKASDLGFDDGKINWNKSQIRSRLYQTWNEYRHNRDADRWIIEKGSVFYIEGGKINIDKIKKGIGSYLSEGFGKILINPEFLLSDEIKLNFKLNKIDELPKTHIKKAVDSDDSDKTLINLLKSNRNLRKSKNEINEKVNEFVKDNKKFFNKITKSQWGQVRTYAKYSQNYETLKLLLFDNKVGFMFHGQSEEVWRKGRAVLKDTILKFKNDSEKIDFTIKLASQMAKNNGGNE